jgi:hypothetical protein
MNLQGLALGWYREEDWPRWCAIDPDFQPDYNHWLRRAEAALIQAEQAGRPFHKVIIDPDEFIEWS